MDTNKSALVTTLRIAGIFLVLLAGIFCLAQDIGIDGPAGLEVSLCGDGQFDITISTTTPVDDIIVEAWVAENQGDLDQAPDFSFVEATGTADTTFRITWPEFDLLPTDPAWDESITISPNCDALSNRELVVEVSYSDGAGGRITDRVFSGPLQVLTPNFVVELVPEVVTNVAAGETANWEVWVSNTGDGLLSGATVTAALPGAPDDGGIENLTFRANIGDTPVALTAPIPVMDLTAGEKRMLGIVSADLTAGTTSSCKNLYVTFTGHYGCQGQDCQDDVIVTGSVSLQYRTPNLSYSFDPTIIDTIPYCSGTDVTVTVENPGATAGNIVGLEMTVDAIGMSFAAGTDTSAEIDVVLDAGTSVFRFVDAADHNLPAVIGPDDSLEFTFTVFRDSCAVVECRSLIFIPHFFDDCGDEFEPPIKELQISTFPPVVSDFDLTVTPDAGNPSIPDEGATLAYTITAVYNPQSGETSATADISVDFPATFAVLPAGTTDPDTPVGNTLTWAGETFTPGNGWTVTKTLALSAGYTGADCDDDFTLHFAVEPTTGMCDSDCLPAGASANLGLLSDTLLVINKDVDGDDTHPGIIYAGTDPLNYTVTVSYYGPRFLIGGNVLTPPTVVTDTMPAGTRYVSGSATPVPNSIAGSTLTWCLAEGTLVQGGALPLTYRIEPIPEGEPGYDECLCGTTITNTATATLNTTGASPCSTANTSPFGCDETTSLTLAYNCDDDTGFDAVKDTIGPASAERCDYETGITFRNTITFQQDITDWGDITFTENGQTIGMVFADPGASPTPLTGTADIYVNSVLAADNYPVTLGTPLNLGDVGLAQYPHDGDVVEIVYELFFSSSANTTGTTVVDWSDVQINGIDTTCADDEFHIGAWVTPIEPGPSIGIAEFCHYDDEGHCTFVVNRCDTSTFRLYLNSTRTEYNVSVVVDLMGNYTYDASVPTTYVGITRLDGTLPAAPTSISGDGRYVTWDLGTLATIGAGSYVQFNLLTECSGGTDTTATVAASGRCGDNAYSASRTYSASRGSREGELLIKKTPDIIYIKDRGTDLPWTIYVTNPGSGPATNVVVTDTLGSGISYVSSTLDGVAATPVVDPPTYGGTETTVTFTIDEIAPGNTVTITLTGHVEGCEERTNRVQATWGCYDEVTGFDYCDLVEGPTVTVQDLGTRVIISGHSAEDINTCGGASHATVSFRNIGKAYAYDMVLTETLPVGVEYDGPPSGASPPWTAVDAFGNDVSAGVIFVDGSNHTTGGGTLTWTFPSTTAMKPVDGTGSGDEFTIVFPVKIVGCTYTSGASMGAVLNYATPCSTSSSPAQDAISTVSAPVLTVSKSPDITAGDPSDPITWTIEINNPSYYTAEAVFLWDVPPTIFSSVAIAGLPGSGTETDPWVIGNIAPHASMAFSAMGTLKDCSTGMGVNTAWVEWCEDCKTSASSNVSGINSVPNVTPDIDLDINYCGGQITLTLVNSGSRAYHVVMTQTFPEGLAYIAGTSTISSNIAGRTFTTEEPDVNAAANTLTWDSDNFLYIEKFETLTITFNLANEMGLGEQCTTSFGTTDSLSVDYDDYCGNNYHAETSEAVTTFEVPDLDVTKTLDPGSIVIGQTDPALWHITIDNDGGPADGTLTIVDTFGSGWDLTSGGNVIPATINGTGTRTIVSNPGGGGTVTWTGVSLGADSSTSFDIQVVPNSTGPEAVLTNSITVTGACIGGCEYGSASATSDFIPGHTEITKVYDRAAATIGETAHVTVTSSYFGSGTSYSGVSLVDTVENGLIIDVSSIEIAIDGTPAAITPTVSGQVITWDLGNFNGTRVFTIEYDVTVANTTAVGTSSGEDNVLSNTATTTYTTSTGTYTDSASDSLDVVEARLVVTKNDNIAPPAYAREAIHYTVTVYHPAGALGDTTAYDVVVTDTVPVGLVMPGSVSVSVGSATIVGRTITWTIPSLAVSDPTATLQYDTTVEDTVIPGQDLTNTAHLTWTSLSGTDSGERTGEGTAPNDYLGDATNTLAVETGGAIVKARISSATATIGSTVTYRITTTLPRATIDTVTITETIGGTGASITNKGIRYLSATFTAPGGGSITPDTTSISSPNDGTDQVTVTWTFNNFPGYLATTAARNLVINITCDVPNVADNQDNDYIPNVASCTYAYDSTSNTVTSGTVYVRLREPNLTIAKAHTVVAPGIVEAGAVIEYTLTLRNTGLVTAYDIDLTDTLPPEFTDATWVSGGTTHDFSGNPLLWHINSLAANTTTTLVYRVTVDDTADLVAGETLTNSAHVTWTSLTGTPGEERTGTGTPTHNDYFRDTTDSVTVSTTTNITKTLTSAATATIGEAVTYRINVTLPRATISPTLTVTETIGGGSNTSNGIRFISAAFTAPGGGSITPSSEVISSPNDGTGQVTVTWTFNNFPGHLATDTDRDLIIDITCDVPNVAENLAGDVIPNRASCAFVGATGTLSTPDVNVTLVEPHLTIAKRVVEVHSPGIVEAGAVIEYELTVTNDSTVTAYDVVVTDTLDNRLISPTDITGGDSSGVSGSDITWNIDSIAAGATETLGYHATVASTNTVTVCATLDNTAVVTWTGLFSDVTGERTGSGTPAQNNYTDDVTLQTPVDTNSTITKDLVPPTEGYWTIGSEVNYLIRVTLPKAEIPSLTVTEYIGGTTNATNGLEFVDATFIAPGGGGLSPTSETITGNDGTSQTVVEWVFSNVHGYQATDDDRELIIVVTARVINVVENVDGDTIPNYAVASGTCLDWPGGSRADSQDVIVREPHLSIAKDVTSIDAPGIVEAGAVIWYELTVTNTGIIPAYDVEVTDTLDDGMVGPDNADVTGGDSHGVSGNVITWNIGVIDAGDSVTLGYHVTVGSTADIAICQALTNTAVVTWTSLNGPISGERTGEGPAPDTYTDTITVNVPVDANATITNTLTSDSSVAIGSTATYDINVTLPKALIPTLTLTETIGGPTDADNCLRYVGAAFTAPGGGSITPTTETVSSPNDGTAQVTVTWVFTDIPGYLATTADRNLVIHVTTEVQRVPDVPENDDLDEVPNTVSASGTCLGWPAGNTASANNVTLHVPALTIEKSVAEILGADGLARATVEPGGTVTYSITVANVGSGEARNVTITDYMLPEFAYVAGSATTPSGVTIAGPDPLVWSVASIPGNSSVTVSFSVTATSAIAEGAVYVNCVSTVGEDILGNVIPADNSAHVSADTYDTTTGTDSSCASVTGGVPTLTLFKEILSVNGVAYTNDMTVQPGDYIIFRVTVNNTGTGTAYDVDITDTLSEGLGYGDYLAPAGDIPPTLGSGTYTSATWSDYYDAGGAPAGSLTAHSHDDAPEDLGGTAPATIGTLIWDGSDIRPLSLPTSLPNANVTGIVLPGGQSYVVEYLAYVNGDIIQHSVAENLADTEATDGWGTTVPCNDDSTSINTREPFFVTEKSITQIDGDPTNTTVAIVGSIIDYSFTVTNVGEGDAHNVNVFDTLPIGFVYVPGSANIGDPTISLDGRDLTWLVNSDIASGGIYTVTFQAEVTDGTSGGTMYNLMWVEGLDLSDQPVTKDGSSITVLDIDSDDADDVPVEVDIPTVPLVLTKEVTPRSVTAGAVVHYTVTFTNNRKISFYDTTITDTMPHGFRYKPGTTLINGVLSADPTGNNPYVFAIGTVGPESVTTLDYYVIVTQAARHGANVNWAVLNAHDGAGKPISLKDRATVTVKDTSFFDFEKFPFLPRFTRPATAPERPRRPEEAKRPAECCLHVAAIPVRSQAFGETIPGHPEIYYQTDIAMYAATELLVTEKRMTPWLEVQGFDPERTYLMTGLYNRMITKLGEYAQYNLGNVVMESTLGIPLDYAPGVLEKAKREGSSPERASEALIKELAESAGLSHVPDIHPIFLEYFGSYPYLRDRIADDRLAWEEDLMDKNVMPAALGFTLLREAGQIETFLASADPTERFFGLLLLTQAVEKTRSISMDLAMTAEFSPPVKYLPHFSRIEIEKGRGLVWRTTDKTSTLYDHASVLWGLSKLRSVTLHSADPAVRSLVPQITERMNEVYRAIEAVHYDDTTKTFVSVHAPGESGADKGVAAKDLAFTILALRSVLLENRDLSLNSIDPKRKIVEIADFMVEKLMGDDGGVYTAYNYADNTPVVGVKRTLVDNALAVRALLSAYVVTEDRKYREAALSVYAFMVKELWNEDIMIFIDEEDPDYEVVLTPQSIGALIGALRELVLHGETAMRHDYLDRMSYTTDRVLDQSQLQLYENRFFPWHAPITIVPKDPNGRSYIKPIITTIRDKGISHDLAPILVRKMVLNITPAGAISSGNEDAVSDWNKWKADLRYEVPDIIASAMIDDTFVTDEGMYFTTLTRDYQLNLKKDLPAFNPYSTDPGIQVYGAFVGDEVSNYNVENLTLNSSMGIGLAESELIRRLAARAHTSPEKYVADYVARYAPKDAAANDVLGRFVERIKSAVGLGASGRFSDIIYLEYASAKPYYTDGIADGWDEETFDDKLTVASISSTMVRQLLLVMDNAGRTDLSTSERFVNEVMTMTVAAKRVALGEIVGMAKKDGIAGVPHGFVMAPDERAKRPVVEITEKKSTLFDDVFSIWAVALFMDARRQGLFDRYLAVMDSKAEDEKVLSALIDALIAHHYNAEYGTLVTGSVNTVEVSKALDMLTRAAEVMDDGPAKEKLMGLIVKQADFIMARLATDTGFAPMIGLGSEKIATDLCEFETLGTNVFPILALVRTAEVTGDEKYLDKALVYFDRFDESKWDQAIGLYLSSGTIYKATDRSRLELKYNNQELIAAVLLISKLQPHLSGERKIVSAYHMTTFMNRIMEIASVERYPANEGSAETVFSPEIIRSVKIILDESRGVGRPGDVFTNRIVIDNDCYDLVDRALSRIRIEQTLPEGFHYVPGSTRFNGAPGPEPIGRSTLNWYYPLLNGANRLVIDYQVVADPNIKEGTYTSNLDVLSFSGYEGRYIICEDRNIASSTFIVKDPFAGDVEKSCVPCDIGRRALAR